jgi:hypothetical protein
MMLLSSPNTSMNTLFKRFWVIGVSVSFGFKSESTILSFSFFGFERLATEVIFFSEVVVVFPRDMGEICFNFFSGVEVGFAIGEVCSKFFSRDAEVVSPGEIGEICFKFAFGDVLFGLSLRILFPIEKLGLGAPGDLLRVLGHSTSLSFRAFFTVLLLTSWVGDAIYTNCTFYNWYIQANSSAINSFL